MLHTYFNNYIVDFTLIAKFVTNVNRKFISRFNTDFLLTTFSRFTWHGGLRLSQDKVLVLSVFSVGSGVLFKRNRLANGLAI